MPVVDASQRIVRAKNDLVRSIWPRWDEQQLGSLSKVIGISVIALCTDSVVPLLSRLGPWILEIIHTRSQRVPAKLSDSGGKLVSEGCLSGCGEPSIAIRSRREEALKCVLRGPRPNARPGRSLSKLVLNTCDTPAASPRC
jgi:hypothetical protein